MNFRKLQVVTGREVKNKIFSSSMLNSNFTFSLKRGNKKKKIHIGNPLPKAHHKANPRIKHSFLRKQTFSGKFQRPSNQKGQKTISKEMAEPETRW